MGSRARWVAVATAISVAAVAVLSVGCSSGEAADPKPVATSKPTTTTSSTTTTMATTTTTSKWTPDQQQAVDRYMAFYDAYFDILTSDRPSNVLADFAAGDFLTKLRILITQDRTNGVATKRPPNSVTRTEIKSVQSQSAVWVVEACEADDLVRTKTSDGSILDDSVVTYRYFVRLETPAGAGALKVTDQRKADELPGDVVDTCLAGSKFVLQCSCASQHRRS